MDTTTAPSCLPQFQKYPKPQYQQSYQDYLDACGVMGQGFNAGELVRGTRRLDDPPIKFWPNMPPTLVLVIELRRRMIERHKAHGLRIQAAYRATGGAKRSRHKSNRALDADLLSQDRHLAEEYYMESTILWCEVGEAFEAGLGLYCPAGRRAGIRTHWDTGTNDRTWQLAGNGVYIRPPASIKIARSLGLEPPTENGQ